MSTPHQPWRRVPWAVSLLALSALGAGGDGDLLRLAGNGRTTFWTPTCYPCVVDFDGDGRRDLVGSNRCTGGVVTWFRNIGTDGAPLFSERETFPLKTIDGQPITNPNRGFLLTVAVCDWDGDGRRDLLVGGLCRYLMFYRNIGTNQRPAFARGKPIFDAKVFPGLDYGDDPNTLFQGVFVEPCDWDGDGNLDLICGTYMRERIYFLRNTGRKDADGLPVLAKPVALEAGGKPIDFLLHGKPSVGDWEGDGKLHLMVGQYCVEGSPWDARGIVGCYYFKNIGDRRHPRLAAGVQVRDAEGRLIAEGFHSQPTMVDWNRDGRQDLLISGMTGTSLYVNQGTGRPARLVRQEIPCVGYAPCRVGGFAYPLAYDLDRDGILDLIVADGDGYVWFFKGLAGLKYAPPVKIKSLGKPIHEVGCPDGGEHHLGYVKVAIADWNGDGHPDLVMWTNNGLAGWQSGQLRDWCLKFFPGTADPMDFGAPTEIRAAGQSIRAGYRCKPEVADLDGDGLLDLVVACGHGTVHDECTVMFFKNLGPAAPAGNGPAGPPRLAAPVPLRTSDGRPLSVNVRTAVRLVDWDGDGKLDLFTGNYWPEGVRYWKNVGTKTRPVFAPSQPLAAVNEIVKSHHEVGVDVVDLDGDGSLDLLVGSGDSGMIHFFHHAFVQQAGIR
jgi:hypothetical protein